MKNVFVFFMLLLLLKNSYGQDSINVNHDNINSVHQLSKKTSNHPYKTLFKKDAPVIIVGLGLTYLGNTLIKNEKPLTVVELADKTKDKIPFFDRGNAGFYSDKINKDSYIPFLGSLPLPIIIMVLNKNERRNASYIMVMYLESLSITSALFTMAAGTIHRPRPLVYGTIAPTDQRINKNNQRSFFAGHTATTASATFFAAKVFQDLNPNSKAKVFVWTVAAAIPAVVGYMRYKSGFHFLSDNLLGYAIGAASGILIPEWHKSKAYKNMTFIPQIAKDFKGFSLVYNIK